MPNRQKQDAYSLCGISDLFEDKLHIEKKMTD